MKFYFSLTNNIKTLINPSILSNLIRKVLAACNCSIKCDKPKYFHMIFHLLKYYQDQNLQFYYLVEKITSTNFNINFF